MPDYTQSPYYNTALAAASQYSVPSALFIAQIGQESGFDPNAQNGLATGIAQFKPATAASLGVNPSNPTSALYGAAQYDAQLYSQYGSWQTAMQKYGTTANGAGVGVANLAQQADVSASLSSANPLNWFSGIGNFDFSSFAPTQAQVLSTIPGGTTVNNTLTGVSSLLNIVTDLPRMVTIIAGLIMLIAGLFMLGAKPAIQIVGQAKKTVGTVAALTA